MSVHEADVDTRLLFKFTELDENGMVVVVDISSATVKKCFLKPPTGATLERPLALTATGVDGKAHYDIVEGDLPVGSKGTWQAQGKVEFGNGKWSADIVDFPVRANLG